MRVCVVGCGAVGSLFAANLATLDDVEVWAYDLSREHVDAVNRDGLRLTGAGEVTGRLRATSDAAEVPPCDFGIVATKAMHDTWAARARLPASSVRNCRSRSGSWNCADQRRSSPICSVASTVIPAIRSRSAFQSHAARDRTR